MSIKIIGAGLPRTGTNTLKEALEKLGFSKTYHMKELLMHPQNIQYWLTLKDSGTTDWDTLYNGYQATVDFPGYPWYKQHIKQYPDAKVILTIRPFDKWYSSLYSTIWQAGPHSVPEKLVMLSKLAFNPHLRSVIKCVKFSKEEIFHNHFEGKFEDKAFVEEKFYRHITDVKSVVPEEKLLVYDVCDGWAPLCNFLAVSQPSEAFPHLNKKENFKEMLGEVMKGHHI